jgi:predicted nucleic acid-binding protein
MKKIFIDTNIVIDLLSRREPFYNEAANLFSLADKKSIELSVSSLTIAKASYTLLRQKTANEAKEVLRKLRLIIKILPLDDKIVGLTLNDDSFSDFEDGLQYFTAIENRQDLIITRNLKDFKNSKLPVMTANQFLETIK